MVDIETFIGREREIAMIETMVFDPQQQNHILPVLGPGGVGKTWLLRALYRRFQNHPDVLVIRTEFAEVRSASLPTLAFNIFKQFSDHFSHEERNAFQERLANWELAVNEDADSISASDAEASIYLFGFELIVSMLQRENKRLLFLSDTLESVKSLELADRINALSANFPNSVIVVVGRPTAEARTICARYQEIYYGWQVHPVHELHPFSNEETTLYFQALLSMPIETELLNKIYLLTGGSPILIAITGEWLRRNVELPSDINLSLAELETMRQQDEKLLTKFQRRFEFGLIDRIRTLGHRIDIATLYLAYVNRRNDRRLLRIILKLDDDAELDDLVTMLHETVFVRKSMTSDGGLLHDEAQRLILEYAWPIIDPDGELRRTLAREVIDGFYLPEIQRLQEIVRQRIQRSLAETPAHQQGLLPPIPEEDWEKRDLQIECLDYQFRISEADGWRYLEALFDEAINYQYSFIQLDQIVGAIYNLAPKQASSTRFRVHVAQMLLRKGESQQARVMAESVLNSAVVSQSEAIAALMVLGDAERSLKVRIHHYTNALARSEGMANKASLVRLYKRLGRTYQQQGSWQEALDAFHTALDLIEPQSDLAQYALLLNYQAQALVLLGELHQADTIAALAEDICRDLRDNRGIALAYASRGMVAERRGDYLQSANFFRIAADLAASSRDVESGARYKVYLASSERHFLPYNNVQPVFQSSLDSRNTEIRQLAHLQLALLALDQTQQFHPPHEESETTHAQLTIAAHHLEAALVLAKSSDDNHAVAVCLLEQIVLERRISGRFHDDPEKNTLLKNLKDVLTIYHFPVVHGRLTELYGDKYGDDGDIERAFTCYLDACLLLEQANTVQFWSTFTRVRARLLALDTVNLRAICALLRKRLLNHGDTATATLLSICSHRDALSKLL